MRAPRREHRHRAERYNLTKSLKCSSEVRGLQLKWLSLDFTFAFLHGPEGCSIFGQPAARLDTGAQLEIRIRFENSSSIFKIPARSQQFSMKRAGSWRRARHDPLPSEYKKGVVTKWDFDSLAARRTIPAARRQIQKRSKDKRRSWQYRAHAKLFRFPLRLASQCTTGCLSVVGIAGRLEEWNMDSLSGVWASRFGECRKDKGIGKRRGHEVVLLDSFVRQQEGNQ